MITKKVNIASIKKQLTVRYAIALSIIACVFLISYATLTSQIKQNEKDAHIINVSGMQRMLSQRIALFSHEIHNAKSTKDAEKHVTKLKATAAHMRKDHEMLKNGTLKTDLGKTHHYPLSDEIKAIYFGEKALAQRLEKYLDYTNQFLQVYKTQGLEAVKNSTYPIDIAQMSENDLLDDLNDVVFQYQYEAENRVDKFKNLEKIILILGLLMLILEIIFIFRPMVGVITNSMNKLEVTNNELTEFTYRLSHDLRAPIVSSKGLVNASKIALENNNLTTVETALDHMTVSMRQLENLIDDVTMLTKLKFDEIPYEDTNITKIINDILNKLSHIENFSQIKIEQNINIENTVKIQKVFLKQSLENLISNAIKYHDTQQEHPIIDITATSTSETLTIKITDNGLGIPKEYRSQMFQMFKRFHPKASFGSGLGLYLVEQNMNAMGGKIKYEPQSKGSAFIITCPINAKTENQT